VFINRKGVSRMQLLGDEIKRARDGQGYITCHHDKDYLEYLGTHVMIIKTDLKEKGCGNVEGLKGWSRSWLYKRGLILYQLYNY
jgi:hypothetical protein